METSTLSQELGSLNARVEQVQNLIVKLDGELRALESEYESFAIDKQRFDVLAEACDVLDRLGAVGGDSLFWGKSDGEGHKKRLRDRIAAFEEQTSGIRNRQENLQKQIDEQNDELDFLFDEIRQAHAREERRQDEFVIEREMAPIFFRPVLMPWSREQESEKRFRRALLISLFWSMALSVIVHLVTVPIPDRTKTVVEIPERLAMLVREEPVMPPPPPVTQPETVEEPVETETPKTAKPEKAAEKKKAAKKAKSKAKAPSRERKGGGGMKGGGGKVRNVGVLAFKSSFSDLMDEVPVARLGNEARLRKPDSKIPGQAQARRSLVAMQAEGGGSQGIGNFGMSRNIGTGGKGGGAGYGKDGATGYGNASQIAGLGTGKVESAMAGLAEEAGRPLSDGLGAGRTDEEIQIVFDRYKAALYRIYNRELRKNPTLRGKLLLKLTIEPSGVVSMCRMESTDLDSKELVKKIVDRVKRFHFGEKEGVPELTILYPIDFLPAG